MFLGIAEKRGDYFSVSSKYFPSCLDFFWIKIVF